jgi:hypothetical protein
MKTSPDTSTTEVLALLTLPDLASLSERQVRGQGCVWCAATLANGTAVDLGPRSTQRAGSEVQWFPRGCPACTALAAHRVLLDHATACEQCADEASKCEAGRGLYRLIRENRR